MPPRQNRSNRFDRRPLSWRRIHRNEPQSDVALLEFCVDAPGFGELVFEDDDPTRRLEGGAGRNKLVRAGGDTQLIARVAAVPTRGALWGEQFRGIEAAKEPLPHAEEFGGVAHAVGGIVFVVELAGQVAGGSLCRDGGLLSLRMDGAPGAGCAGGRDGSISLTEPTTALFELPNAHTMSGSPLEGGCRDLNYTLTTTFGPGMSRPCGTACG